MRNAAAAMALTLALFAAPLSAQSAEWTHGVLVAKADAGFVFMAARRGFAERQGIELEIAEFRSDAVALRALIAGELDSFEGSPGGAMVAASEGARVKIVGCYWPELTYGIFARPNIASVADLAHARVAISAPGALPELLVRAVLEQNNISDDDITFAALGGDVDRFQALAAGIADAAAASTELVPDAEARGLHLLVHAHEAMPQYLRFCIYMRADTIAERAEDAAHYLAAQSNALRFALNDREATLALAHEVTGSDAADVNPSYIYDEVMRLNAITPDLAIPEARLVWMRDLLTRTGSMRRELDVAAMIDNSVRTRAMTLVDTAP